MELRGQRSAGSASEAAAAAARAVAIVGESCGAGRACHRCKERRVLVVRLADSRPSYCAHGAAQGRALVVRSRQRGGLVEVSSPAEADRKTLGTWGVWQSGWRSVAAKECFSCGAHWRAWVGRRHALVDRASDDATVRASGSKEEAAGGAVWRSVAIRSGAGQACRPGSQRSLRCGLRQHAQKQQSAAGQLGLRGLKIKFVSARAGSREGGVASAFGLG